MSALTNAYIFLILAIIAEVIGTLYLRETEGFTKVIPSLITAISYAASFYWLSFTLDEIPVGVAYATWSGVGIFLITGLAAIKYLQIPNLYTTVGMGTDQGKTSNVNALMLLSQILDCEPEQVGYTTFRPPYAPTTILSLIHI